MGENFTYYSSLYNNAAPPAVMKFPVAAAQAISRGDLLVLSSGQLALATTSITEVFAVAMQDSASADAGTLIEVQLILPGTTWRATASADASSVALTSRKFDLTTGQVVDITDTTNGCIHILRTLTSTTDIEITFTEFEIGAS